jgi:hypothetical protein
MSACKKARIGNDEDGGEFTLRVITAGAATCDVQIRPTMTIAQLKEEVASESGVPADEQRLMLATREAPLEDCNLVSAYELTAESSVHCLRLQVLRNAEPALTFDRDYVLAVVTDIGTELKYASEALRRDREVVIAAVTSDWRAIKFVEVEDFVRSEVSLAHSHAVLLALITSFVEDDAADPEEFESCLPGSGSLDDFVHFAIDPFQKLRRDGGAQNFHLSADQQLNSAMVVSDRVIMLAAVARYAPDSRRTFGYMAAPGRMLEYCCDELKRDREVVLTALAGNYGPALRWASPALCADHEIVLHAVKTTGDALQYASEELRANREIIIAALESGRGRPMEHASTELCADKALVMLALHHSTPGDDYTLEYASAELQADQEVVLAAVEKSHTAIRYAETRYRMHRPLAMAALTTNGACLEFLWPFQDDKGCVMVAVAHPPLAMFRCMAGTLDFASEELRADFEVVMEAVRYQPFAVKAMITDSMSIEEQKLIALEALHQDARVCIFIPDHIIGCTDLHDRISNELRYKGGGSDGVIAKTAILSYATTHKFPVFVKTLMGTTFSFEVNVSKTCRVLKEDIEASQGMPVDQQRLIFAGRELASEDELSDYGLMFWSTMHLVLTLRGRGTSSLQTSAGGGAGCCARTPSLSRSRGISRSRTTAGRRAGGWRAGGTACTDRSRSVGGSDLRLKDGIQYDIQDDIQDDIQWVGEPPAGIPECTYKCRVGSSSGDGEPGAVCV